MDMAGSETADRTDAIVAEDSGTKHVESPSSTRNPEPFSFQRRQTKRSNRRQIKLGPYLLLQTLGEGEFGKVKLGIHTETGQEVRAFLSFFIGSSCFTEHCDGIFRVYSLQ